MLFRGIPGVSQRYTGETAAGESETDRLGGPNIWNKPRKRGKLKILEQESVSKGTARTPNCAWRKASENLLRTE